MKFWIKTAALACTVAVIGCSPVAADTGGKSAARPAATAPATHPVSGLPVVTLTVSGAKGPHTFRVEVARTSEEQAQGLMFRTAMGADEGMIFPMDPPRDAAFWMKNTVIPLDIIFIGPDRRILNIAANAVPYDLTSLPSDGIAAGVLELNGGRAAELGIKPGDKVEW